MKLLMLYVRFLGSTKKFCRMLKVHIFKKIIVSFFSVWFAWLVTYFASLFIRQQYNILGGSSQDFEFWLAWPFLFSYLVWFFILLPLLLIDKTHLLLSKFPQGPIIGALSGGSIMLILLLLFGYDVFSIVSFKHVVFILMFYSTSIGFISLFVYSCLIRMNMKLLRLSALILIPFVFFYLYLFIFPAIFPKFTFQYLGGSLKNKALKKVLSESNVGDSILVIEEKIPGFFHKENEILPCEGFTSGQFDGFSYTLRYKDCKIIHLDTSI